MLDIMEQLGGWPVVMADKWDKNIEWNWTWAIKKLRQLGYLSDHIFKFSIDIDLKNSTTRIIYVSFVF